MIGRCISSCSHYPGRSVRAARKRKMLTSRSLNPLNNQYNEQCIQRLNKLVNVRCVVSHFWMETVLC